MERALIRKLAQHEKDSDMDGTPDHLDGNPTWTTNDMDNDGDPDFFDPEPNDSFIYSSNDPLNLSNEEFWEDN